MVDVYIALTEFSRRKFIAGGLPGQNIIVKPNFVDFDPGSKDKTGDYALFIGRLSTEKGIKTLLKAWYLSKPIPLKVIGDGPLMGELKTIVQSQKLRDVELMGHKPYQEVITLMKGARFLIFPSVLFETFGRVAIEAFVCGVPVIASRLGAMAEIVEDGRTGVHFNPGDPVDLATKVEWAWTNSSKMEEMGRNARREYEEKYTAERNYKMLMEIYRLAIERSKKKTKG
jgi:glycosyltransferase involved in cell wall biosynthesis